MFKRLIEVEVDFDDLNDTEIHLIFEDILFRMKNDGYVLPMEIVTCILEMLVVRSSMSELIKALLIVEDKSSLVLTSEELGVTMDIDMNKWTLDRK
jgi:hypothetical protein